MEIYNRIGLRILKYYLHRMASDRFQVDIKDLAGQSATVQCTPDTPVSYLISQFRDNISPMYKRHVILLFKDDGSAVKLDGTYTPLDVMGTLKSNGIEHNTKLFAIYKFWVSCINPEPFVGHLHDWIENNINKFKSASASVRVADCTDFFKQYNKWGSLPGDDEKEEASALEAAGRDKAARAAAKKAAAEERRLRENGKHSFFLTNTQMHQFDKIVVVETNTHTNEPIKIGYKSELSKIPGPKLSKTLRSKFSELPAYVEYNPKQLGHSTRGLIPNNIFVRGILDKVEITINQKKGTQGRTLDRGFKIYVILKGPIEICAPNGDIQHSSNNPDAECHIPYDYIEMCSSPAEFYMSNNTQGGGRVKRTKRSKRSKRTQKKRKTRRQTHKKRR